MAMLSEFVNFAAELSGELPGLGKLQQMSAGDVWAGTCAARDDRTAVISAAAPRSCRHKERENWISRPETLQLQASRQAENRLTP